MTTILFTKTCRRDLPLAEYQAKLIAKHWKNTPPHVYVVDENGEIDQLAQTAGGPERRVSIITTREAVPFPEEINGYLRQQMVKILAPWCVRTALGGYFDSTFQIDADCMPCAPFDWNDFQPSWLYYPEAVWPIPHVKAQIPSWSRTARTLVQDGLSEEFDDFTFMAGLGWWVPNEAADFVASRLTAASNGSIVETFKRIQAQSMPFSEYQTLGRVMYRGDVLLGRLYHFRRGVEDKKHRPQFKHIPLQPGGRGFHLSPPDKQKLEEMLR